ncbi:MAG: exodeoxyribonuclease VII small subunit [Bacteroidota bacterium]|nr:exodeoxyribonuclease VII small subunit [Bacteroidota bacterium]MCY3630535.1 exodeoxyribonuclease VII small subunit [Bacteroidota bacterium]MDE2644843.1 exodeoxyribonuclease VII small subunit [Bacteroidota bacterium]
MKNELPETNDSLDTLMKRLESIAKALSEGSGTLESSLKQYEEGIELAKECLTRLDAAEQRVTELREELESDPNHPAPLTGKSFPID